LIPHFQAPVLRLGHIVYSNCFPVHARLLDRPAAGDPVLVEGVPSELNALLARGVIHAAPCSSIEYAIHGGRYGILPDLVIGSRGAVRSIVLLSRVEPERLGGLEVALPTASATSVVLLKILLRTRWGVEARFRWFDQARDDPFAGGSGAALFIGDVALRRDLHPEVPVRLDLGLEWWRETGLPFAFAVWQTNHAERAALLRLHEILLESREYGCLHLRELAERYADHFRMEPPALASYWADLSYDLDEPMARGLERFYLLATEIGELTRAPEIRYL
jgi:chorismate dehydratase